MLLPTVSAWTKAILRRQLHATGAVVINSRIVELVVRVVIAPAVVILVEKGHNINNGLRVLLLLLLRDTVRLQCALPFFRKPLSANRVLA